MLLRKGGYDASWISHVWIRQIDLEIRNSINFLRRGPKLPSFLLQKRIVIDVRFEIKKVSTGHFEFKIVCSEFEIHLFFILAIDQRPVPRRLSGVSANLSPLLGDFPFFHILKAKWGRGRKIIKLKGGATHGTSDWCLPNFSLNGAPC